MAEFAHDQEIADQVTTADQIPDQAPGCAADGACCGHAAGTSRRSLLRAAGIGGAVAAVAVTAAACSGSSSPAYNNPQPASTGGGDTGSPSSAAGSSSSAAAGSGGGSSALTSTSAVPVQGGVIMANADGGIVITQPSSGTFKAFSSTCTHMGCTVGTVADNKITCPCHGSVYSATDGSVINGPAPLPLPAKKITVTNGQIFAA